MRVHHLNCGSMQMPGAHLVCHVLLLETAIGLALVDTGFGLRDVADPAGRIGVFRHVIRPALDEAETAIRQVEALGHSAADVTDIVLTHLDLDHTGGLADFPNARVHLTAAEARGGLHRPSLRERIRFRAGQWAHGVDWVEHGPGAEAWQGFPGAVPLSAIDDGLVLVPMPGHTRGHAAVAVDVGDRWLLHAGDAFYHHSAIDGVGGQAVSVTVQEHLVAFDDRRRIANRNRLAELHRSGSAEVDIVSAHDPELFAAAVRRTAR